MTPSVAAKRRAVPSERTPRPHRGALIGLRMPRALEALDHTLSRIERGEITAIEAIASLLSEEYATRETRRIDVALRTPS